MNLIEELEKIYPANIEVLKPRYKAETVGVFFYLKDKTDETSKRNGNSIQKYTAQMTILTKNWYVFSFNFTIKIDTTANSVSVIGAKPWFRLTDADFVATKPQPLKSTAWRVQAKSYNYWDMRPNSEWYSGAVSYDMGRSIKEQALVLVGELLKNRTSHEKPANEKEFVNIVQPFVEGIIAQDEPFVVFDPTVGIDTYRVDYEPIEESENTPSDVSSETPKISEVITYPRGANDVYYARRIMGHVDVELLRKFRESSLYCRLEGDPGCGKTALVEASFGEELLTANGNGDYSSASFIGEWTVNVDRSEENPQEFAWTDGILCRAMKEGRPLLIDEATLLPSSALDAIHSATDGRGYITLDEFPGKPRVDAKEGFYVIMAYNPQTLHGREIPEAIRSRFGIVLTVQTDFSSLNHFDIPQNMVRVASRMNNFHNENKDRGGRGYWVPQMRELLTFKKLVDTGLDEAFAFNNLVGLCPEIFREKFIKTIHDVTQLKSQNLSLGGLARVEELSGEPDSGANDIDSKTTQGTGEDDKVSTAENNRPYNLTRFTEDN